MQISDQLFVRDGIGYADLCDWINKTVTSILAADNIYDPLELEAYIMVGFFDHMVDGITYDENEAKKETLLTHDDLVSVYQENANSPVVNKVRQFVEKVIDDKILKSVSKNKCTVGK